MKNPLEKLIEHSGSMTLRDDEKQALRESLLEYIDKNPIPERNVAAPARPRFFETMGARIGLAAIAILFLGAGIVLGAEKAIPGDILYPMKIAINEPVRGFLTFSSEGKARAEILFTSRRLIEAETLESESRLTSAAKAELAADFKKHVNKVSAEIKKIAEKNDIQTAIKTNFELVSVVGSHSRIVMILTATSSAASTSTAASAKGEASLNIR